MLSKKRLSPDGSTKYIIIQKDNGAFSSFSPKEAVEAISELKAQLWSGVPMDNQFKKARI